MELSDTSWYADAWRFAEQVRAEEVQLRIHGRRGVIQLGNVRVDPRQVLRDTPDRTPHVRPLRLGLLLAPQHDVLHLPDGERFRGADQIAHRVRDVLDAELATDRP